MPVKQIDISGIGPVDFYKRRASRSIRISITHQGQVRVSLPFWVPYSSGVAFVKSRSDWIETERPTVTILNEGFRLGKAHHLTFQPGTGKTITTRLTATQARVLLPAGVSWNTDAAQQAAATVAIKALKKEANLLLPRRLKTLAEQHDFTYSSVTIKQLSGRWGSCSSQQEIVLNCFLMQLPWDLIDYVLLHELTHTKVMAHGPAFWQAMERVLPNVQMYRNQIKQQKPVL